MANRLIVGQALAYGLGEVTAYPDHVGDYSTVLAALAEDLDVEARYSDDDEWFCLIEIITALNDKVNDALE